MPKEKRPEPTPEAEPLGDEQLLEAMRALPAGTKERAAFESIENHQRTPHEFRRIWFIAVGHLPDPAQPSQPPQPAANR